MQDFRFYFEIQITLLSQLVLRISEPYLPDLDEELFSFEECFTVVLRELFHKSIGLYKSYVFDSNHDINIYIWQTNQPIIALTGEMDLLSYTRYFPDTRLVRLIGINRAQCIKLMAYRDDFIQQFGHTDFDFRVDFQARLHNVRRYWRCGQILSVLPH